MRLLAFLLICLSPPAFADAVPYLLDRDRSAVAFSYLFSGNPTEGQMPVAAAELFLDLDDIPNSNIAVTLNADAARAGFIFATEAMKGASVLNTRDFPTISFRTTQIIGDLSGATVTGDLTIRGITRQVTLDAKLFRQRGTVAGDRSRLSVLLTGQVNRNDFGASGWSGYVGPDIDLKILARMNIAQ